MSFSAETWEFSFVFVVVGGGKGNDENSKENNIEEIFEQMENPVGN